MAYYKTIADRLSDAVHTGKEAVFFDDEDTRSGPHEFTPEGLLAYFEANADITTAAELAAGLSTKEPTITAGTTGQYWRGDKSWQTLDKTAVGLPNVDNTTDLSKPISTLTQAALDLKAPKASPTFTGTPTVPTAAAGTDTTQIASTAFVQEEISVNQPTDVGRPLYVRSAKDWLDALGVMAGPTPGDIEDAIVEAVATGRRIFVPAGDYTMTSQITISLLSDPLRLEFDPLARIIADATLTDGFIKVNDGADYAVEIEGGQWIADDQPKPVGSDSWALISLSNIKGGGIHRARFQAGADYRDEKSDSAVFVVAEDFSIDKCKFTGFYDSGIYGSGNSLGSSNFGVKVTNSDFYGCAVGFITKRLSSASFVADNTFKRCRNGIATGHASEQQPAGKLLVATGNQLHDCRTPFYLVWAHGSLIEGNIINGWGYDASDTVSSGQAAIRLLGTQNAKIIGNLCKNTTPESTLNGVKLEEDTYTASGGGTTTNQSTYNTISENDFDGGAGCNRAMYEANSSDYNTFSMNNLFGTWTSDVVMTGANTLSIRKTAAGKIVTTFQNTEKMVLDTDNLDVKPSTSGALRVWRNGSSVQYFNVYSTSGGHRLEGISAASSAKNTYYDSNADGAVSGGELAHNFRISGTTKLKVSNTKISVDMTLLGNYADDAAAAAGSVAIGEAYRTGSILKFRVA